MGLNRSQARPRVVALLPAWQAADFIEPTLASLAQQSWTDLEVLISVDRSSDRTAEICRSFAQGHANAQVVVHEQRLGWIGNVNWLLDHAKGDLLLIAAHDDLLAPTYVERLVEALEAHPAAAIAFSDMELTHQDGRTEVCSYDVLEGVHSAVTRGARVLWRVGHWGVPMRGVFRAEAAKRIGGLKQHRAGDLLADWPWILHLALIGEPVRIPEVLCRKRLLPTGASSAWRFSAGGWLAVSVSCAGEIRRSDLSPVQKVALIAVLIWVYVSTVIIPGLLRRLRAAARRIMPFRPDQKKSTLS
jgi:glycosyltransferase involved in cell wall biosynthesis